MIPEVLVYFHNVFDDSEWYDVLPQHVKPMSKTLAGYQIWVFFLKCLPHLLHVASIVSDNCLDGTAIHSLGLLDAVL